MKLSYEQYHAFSAPLEGRVRTMYCDCLGLITTGVGNLINTLAQARALPWLLADGSKAQPADIDADWNLLNSRRPYYAKRAWHVYAAAMRCHLSDDAIDALCKRQLASNEAGFRKRWANYDRWPADAQLACHSMGWAVGAEWFRKFPIGSACLDREDWAGAAAACVIRTGTPGKDDWNPGVVPRNAKNKLCFLNAAAVAGRPEAETLWWPDSPELTQAAAPLQRGDHAKLVACGDARDAAARAEADWHADPLCRFVRAEYGRVTDALPLPGRALLDYESEDT